MEYKFINSDIDHLGLRVLKEERKVAWVVLMQPWIYVGGGKERESVAPNILLQDCHAFYACHRKVHTGLIVAVER